MSTFGDQGMYQPERKPLWHTALGLLLVAVLAIFLLRSLHSGGGIFSSNNCGTNQSYTVPSSQLKGVDAKMSVERCTDSSASKGHKQYILLTLDVGGQTADKSRVLKLHSRIQLDHRKAVNAPWSINVPLSDIPEDSGVNTEGGNVAYKTQRRWDIKRGPTRVRVRLVLRTSKGEPVSASHIFNLP
jgi:hypothetical protein